MRWNDLIGMHVGQYTIVEELGRGGAARVFRAFDETNTRSVAFKVLPIETDDRLAFMRRFAREADAVRALQHPNIVQVYDSGENEEFVYLVLRLLGGGTLRQRIARQRISTQEVSQYMIQIALALHHAHQLGIIHRDVKPSNMLLDSEQPGQILLSDFGTAKILTAVGLTKTGATIGTPEYMSPEQAEGREVDQRSDIYSLGCALYEALAGRPPFVGANSLSVLYQQVHAQPTYVRSYNAEAPRELWSVLRICLAKRPEERYGTAAQLAEALQPFADGLIQPTPAPWHSPVTGRLASEGLDSPSRPRRATSSAPFNTLPPPFTPAPLPVTPGRGAPPPGGAGPIPLYLEGATPPTPPVQPAPHSGPVVGSRGARPTLRLPSTTGRSGLLNGALSPEGRQAISAFEAKLEAEERQAPAAPPTQRAPTSGGQATPAGLAYADIYPTAPTPTPTPPRAPNSGPFGAPGSGRLRTSTSGPLSGPLSGPSSGPAGGSGGSGGLVPAPVGAAAPYAGDAAYAAYESYRAPESGRIGTTQRAPTSGPHRGPASGRMSGPLGEPAMATRRAQTSIPVDLDRLRADIDPTTLGRKRRRRPSRLGAALAAAAMVALLVAGVAFGVGGLKLFAQPSAPKATPLPTATTAPTPTATVAQPTATTTPTAQQNLDSRAANAFRAITIAPFSDSRCSSGNMTTQYNGQPVYINLCLANASAPGPVTVVVRQKGAIVRTLISNLYPSAGAYYTQGHTLGAGSYDMLVTMQIGGKQATAKDIAFTVR